MSNVNLSKLDDNTLEKIVSEISNSSSIFEEELNKRNKDKKLLEEKEIKKQERNKRIMNGEIPAVWMVLTDIGFYRYIEFDLDDKEIYDIHKNKIYEYEHIYSKIEDYVADHLRENMIECYPLYIKN